MKTKLKMPIKRQRLHQLASTLVSFRISVMALPLVFLACSSAPSAQQEPNRRLPTDAEVEQYNAQVDAEERIVCREEIPVGTNIPQRKCRLIRDINETSRFHREQLRNTLH